VACGLAARSSQRDETSVPMAVVEDLVVPALPHYRGRRDTLRLSGRCGAREPEGAKGFHPCF